jgi:rsbT antagonist protein RsbS
MGTGDGSKIPLRLSHGCVVASIQVDLDEDVLVNFREDLLSFLQNSGARGVILDLSGVEIMDTEDFNALRATMHMARLMGARSILSGMQAGVVSALIDLDADTEGIEATLTLDDAFECMNSLLDVEGEESAPEDSEAIPEDPDEGSASPEVLSSWSAGESQLNAP